MVRCKAVAAGRPNSSVGRTAEYVLISPLFLAKRRQNESHYEICGVAQMVRASHHPEGANELCSSAVSQHDEPKGNRRSLRYVSGPIAICAGSEMPDDRATGGAKSVAERYREGVVG